MKKLLSTLLIAFALISSASAQAQEQTGIANVKVLVCDASGNVVAKGTTKSDGTYDITVQRASSDYYLKIDEKDRASKIAIKEQGVRTVSTGDVDGDGYEYFLQINDGAGYSVKSPRDAASGQATGKRQHAPIRIVKEWESSSIAIDEPGVHITGQIYGMAINEKGLPGEKKPKKSTK
jgi:hypothetical protein